MWKNYLSIAFRSLQRHKTSTFIHIAGLGVGIVSAILILFYVHFERSYESMHANADNIYRIAVELYNGNEYIETDAATYQTLGPELKDKWPAVADFVRFYPLNISEIKAVSNHNKGFESKIYYADPSALNIFTYEYIDSANIKKFEEPFTIIITEKQAFKYFGKSDVAGELLLFDFWEDPMEIVGVMKDLPQNTHLKFDFLISHITLPIVEPWYAEYLWNANNDYTYLLINEGIDVAAFNEKLKNYSISHPLIQNEVIIAEKIKDIHLYSDKSYEPEVNSSAQTVNFMFYTGLLILILAWINYINLSTAKAMERAKEVGIRKTIGSSKGQLIWQFYAEAFLTNALAATFATIAAILILPAFGNFTGQDLTIEQVGWPGFLILVLTFILFGTLVSGTYPAIILSGFKPISVLKGKFSTSSKGIFMRKALVFTQFTASVILICLSLAIYMQMQHLTHQDLGVDIDNTLVIRKPSNSTEVSEVNADNLFVNLLESVSNVKGVTQAGTVPGADINELHSNNAIRRQGADPNEGSFNYYHFGVKENYPELMELDIIAGRPFDYQTPDEMIMISEKAREYLGFSSAEEAIGQKLDFHISNKQTEILGVFENFHQRSPKEQYLPLFIYQSAHTSNFIVKLNTADSREALVNIQSVWEKAFPENSFDYYFLDDQYHRQYHQEWQFGKTILLSTFLALIIACLGLFGLSSYLVLLRTKEIGIRKVLGASVGSLVGLLSKDFMSVILIASMAAVPIAYYLIQEWLKNYASGFQLDWVLFMAPILIIMIIALLTVGSHTLASANTNPVDSLRSE